ncbi:hypothetical protein PAXRUDRAFT_181701 [Paxillus rubicundulus Ve08.2h10]|uniref:Uncharacterized protein n=1 Tax=Paxillus rubicundulus Ve08.2h10 TaxID=930991 RepID=A0A0D0BJN9_9AGAM|nr:hypothetical protein PAXRUDRAFT_181701 [Paxillus rubicundulus Ve08.2h10]
MLYPTQPHHLPTQPMHQMANHKAADTSNLNAMCTGMTKPVGMLYGPLNEGRNVKKVDETGEWASGSVTPSSNDDSGDEDVCHTYIVPNMTQPPPYHALPTPDEQRQPLSMPLEGEKTGQQSSRHTDELGTHLDVPERRC